MTERRSVWNKSTVLLRENSQYYYVIVSQLGFRKKYSLQPSRYDSSPGHTRGSRFGVLAWPDESVITIICAHYAGDPLLLVQARDCEARRQQATMERDGIDKQASGR